MQDTWDWLHAVFCPDFDDVDVCLWAAADADTDAVCHAIGHPAPQSILCADGAAIGTDLWAYDLSVRGDYGILLPSHRHR